MAKRELTIEVSELRCLQISCGNPGCSGPEIVYEKKPSELPQQTVCPGCGMKYPEELIEALKHYVRFCETAKGLNEKGTRISLQARL